MAYMKEMIIVVLFGQDVSILSLHVYMVIRDIVEALPWKLLFYPILVPLIDSVHKRRLISI